MGNFSAETTIFGLFAVACIGQLGFLLGVWAERRDASNKSIGLAPTLASFRATRSGKTVFICRGCLQKSMDAGDPLIPWKQYGEIHGDNKDYACEDCN